MATKAIATARRRESSHRTPAAKMISPMMENASLIFVMVVKDAPPGEKEVTGKVGSRSRRGNRKAHPLLTAS
jgi:hypothetical protein